MGYALRRMWLPQGVATLLRNQWQLCRGMRGNFAMESVASFAWNRWQVSYGTGGNFRAEYASTNRCRLRPLIFLPPSYPRAGPPISVVLTDWLSMHAALGVGSRPASTRVRSRRALTILAHVPSSRHWAK